MDTSPPSGRATSAHKWYTLRASNLPPAMLAGDPRLFQEIPDDCSVVTEAENFSPLSESLSLKDPCPKEEAELFECAGKDTAVSVLSRVGRVDIETSTFHQESVVMESGVPLYVALIRPEEVLPVSLRIINLVSRLHAKAIVHGNVTPSAFRWNSERQILFSDFANARLAN
ncbi:hypothetical protein B0T25DRAFT_516239 [Lasiosphaeria hispida]|uniref:Protein kinase domain-containing protein n=1 Tax=Lasiosphaeria hispida TaxID=260671 RepID=A0AAJ0HL56_9PEZI|nr:hypothetical protein B0T25DRAFT_516239 [Lasiosphaeria hispida]